MTGPQALVLLAATPALAAVVGIAVRARSGVILTAAVVGELIAYVVTLAWTQYAMRRTPLTEGTLRATADIDVTTRLMVVFALASFAMLVAGAGIGVRHLVVRLWPGENSRGLNPNLLGLIERTLGYDCEVVAHAFIWLAHQAPRTSFDEAVSLAR